MLCIDNVQVHVDKFSSLIYDKRLTVCLSVPSSIFMTTNIIYSAAN